MALRPPPLPTYSLLLTPSSSLPRSPRWPLEPQHWPQHVVLHRGPRSATRSTSRASPRPRCPPASPRRACPSAFRSWVAASPTSPSSRPPPFSRKPAPGRASVRAWNVRARRRAMDAQGGASPRRMPRRFGSGLVSLAHQTDAERWDCRGPWRSRTLRGSLGRCTPHRRSWRGTRGADLSPHVSGKRHRDRDDRPPRPLRSACPPAATCLPLLDHRQVHRGYRLPVRAEIIPLVFANVVVVFAR